MVGGDLSFIPAGQPLRAVQHQLCKREASGIFQQAHFLPGAARVQQVGGSSCKRGGSFGFWVISNRLTG